MKKLLFLICCLPFLSGCFEEEYTVQNSNEFLVMIDDVFFNRDGPCDIDIGDKVKFLKGSPKICKGGTDPVTLENLSIKKTCRLKCMKRVTNNEQSMDNRYFIDRVSEKWATVADSTREYISPEYINLETSKITRDEDGRKKVYVETIQKDWMDRNSLDAIEISCLKPETLEKMSKNQGIIAREYIDTNTYNNTEKTIIHKKYEDELKVRVYVAKQFPLADKFGEGSDFRLFPGHPDVSEEERKQHGRLMSAAGFQLTTGGPSRCKTNEVIKNQRDKNPETEKSYDGKESEKWYLWGYLGEKESNYVKNQYCDVTYDMFDERFERLINAKNYEEFRGINGYIGGYCSGYFESFLEKAKKLKF